MNTAPVQPLSPAGASRLAGSGANLAVIGVFVIICAIEFYLFDQVGAHAHTKVYPRWFDQIQYLTEAYTGYEYAKANGFGEGLVLALTNPSAQGTLHDVYTLVAFSLFGPSRSAALALNILALICWQVALLYVSLRLLRSAWIALAFAVLPIALFGPWRSIPGSAFDFRLDHLAMCAMGVAVTLAVTTEGFRSRGHSAAFGVAVGITLLTRFLTGTYLLLMFIAMVAWLAFQPESKRRISNLLIAALIAILLAAPVYWINRDWIWNYYWIGHYVGPESAIRNPNFGVTQSINFVGRHLYQEHLGLFFVGAFASVTAFLLLSSRVRRPAESRNLWGLSAITVLAPAVILILHVQKSPVVLGIMVPGVMVFILALWHRLTAQDQPHRTTPVAAGIAVLACLGFYLQAQLAPPFDAAQGAEYRRVTRFGEMISSRAALAGSTSPRIAVDQVTDALDGQVLRVTNYERTGLWMPFEMMLPTGIAAPTDAEVMERLRLSDFVFVTIDRPQINFPYDRKLAEMNSVVRSWCSENLREVESFSFNGSRFLLYERPAPPPPSAAP